MEKQGPIEVPLNMKCPLCYKSSLTLRYIVTDLPYLGQAVVLSIKCSNCNFKVTDTILGEKEEKSTTEVSVSEDTMGDLIVFTGHSIIKIPQLGLELELRTENVSEITTVEGILSIFIDNLESFVPDDEIGLREKEKLLAVLKGEAEKPSGKLKIIIEDLAGKSLVVSREEWARKAEEARKMQFE